MNQLGESELVSSKDSVSDWWRASRERWKVHVASGNIFKVCGWDFVHQQRPIPACSKCWNGILQRWSGGARLHVRAMSLDVVQMRTFGESSRRFSNTGLHLGGFPILNLKHMSVNDSGDWDWWWTCDFSAISQDDYLRPHPFIQQTENKFFKHQLYESAALHVAFELGPVLPSAFILNHSAHQSHV